MKRTYQNHIDALPRFFVGDEVEHNAAFGKKTLFVVGLQSTTLIERYVIDNECKHIFFGANHSFSPELNHDGLWEEFEPWEKMIKFLLEKDYLCSLDIPIYVAEESLEMGLQEYSNFIPQIRVPIPYVEGWNYNTVVKIDDKGFDQTNPGVWCHRLHDLMDIDKFSTWSDYNNDRIVGGR